MRLKDGFLLTDVVGDYMLMPIGENADTFGGYIALNESSAFLLKQMNKDISVSELVERLMNEYETDTATAQESVEYTIQKLLELGVIEGSPE